MIHFLVKMESILLLPQLNWIFTESWANKSHHWVKKCRLKRNKIKKFPFYESPECLEVSCLLSPRPGPGYHLQWHQREGRPHPISARPRDGRERLAVDRGGSAAGPVSQVQLPLWSPAADLHVSKTRSRGREHAAEPVSPPFNPCSLQTWKKGLIVFNNMLSNPPYHHDITTTLPSLIRIRITSGAMFCPSLLLNLITTRSRGRDRAGFLSTLFAFFLPLAHLICLAAPSILRLH